MLDTLSIRPSRDLRNHYADISQLSRNNPVAITVNGREDTVIMSYDQFVRLQHYLHEVKSRLAVYQHLAQSQDDIRLGRCQDADEAVDELLRELGGDRE